MNELISKYIDRVREPNHTKVYFRFKGYGDNVVMHIDLFLHEFKYFKIGLNGEFVKPDGTILHDCFIKKTG